MTLIHRTKDEHGRCDEPRSAKTAVHGLAIALHSPDVIVHRILDSFRSPLEDS